MGQPDTIWINPRDAAAAFGIDVGRLKSPPYRYRIADGWIYAEADEEGWWVCVELNTSERPPHSYDIDFGEDNGTR